MNVTLTNEGDHADDLLDMVIRDDFITDSKIDNGLAHSAGYCLVQTSEDGKIQVLSVPMRM